MKKSIVFVLLVAGACLLNAAPRPVLAADTVETWGVGATDVDFYLGLDGIGLGKYEKTVFGDIMLGYGLVERFSAYFGTTLQANEYFSDGFANVYMGIFGTPVETDHFDLDLFLDVSLGGPYFDEFAMSPSLELNVDLDPEMRSWGAYLRVPFPVQGRKIQPDEHPDSERFDVSFSLVATLGAYYTVADGHQILVEYDTRFHPDPEAQERQIDVGTIALGYNVVLVEAIELINHFYLDIPQDDKTTALGVMIGIITTMP